MRCTLRTIDRVPDRLRFVFGLSSSICGILLWACNVLPAQTPKGVSGRPDVKPIAGYQVDVRLRVASGADKMQVVQWVQALKAAGAAGVSQVPGAASPSKEGEPEEPTIQSAGAGRVLVVGAIGPAGNLHVGSQGFRLSDRGSLEAFMKKLRAEGVPAPDPSDPLWGLSQTQFNHLQTALRPPSNFDLRDKPLGEFLADLSTRTKLPIKLSDDAQRAGRNVRLNTRIVNVSVGAALAYVLSLHDLSFEPRQSRDGTVSLMVLSARESKRSWPVGLPPDQMPGIIAPQLMNSVRYQTKDTSFRDVIAMLVGELQMDILIDTQALAQKNIDPTKLRSTVEITPSTVQSAIRKTLAPLGLKHELRIDEADRPFLWVTVGEPTGPVPKGKAKGKG